MKDLYRPLTDFSAAAQRLTGKYGTEVHRQQDFALTAGEALAEVDVVVAGHLDSFGYHGGRPAPDRHDCLAALTLADEARTRIDRQELTVIKGARALGAGWQEIGIALGHTPATAERAAQARFGALRRRFPGARPIATPTSAPTPDPAGSPQETTR